jgi:hypothetical protein
MNLAFARMLIAITAIGACTANLVEVRRSDDRADHAAVTQLWDDEVRRIARDGDWIIARASATGTLVYAGMYDHTHATLVEADDAGAIRETPLGDALARSHSLIIVRPSNMTAVDAADALARARTRLGTEHPGNPAGFLTWASQTAARAGSSDTATPADLMRYGEVVYWSGGRDDEQVMVLASEHMNHTQAKR